MSKSKDPKVVALNWAIACLSGRKHEEDIANLAVLCEIRDLISAHPVVGEIEGEAIRVGDLVDGDDCEVCLVREDGYAYTQWSQDGPTPRYRLDQCSTYKEIYYTKPSDFEGKP